MTDTIRAPWTQEQVDRLNEYQRAGAFHPFTCPREHSCSERLYGAVELVATVDGWVCPKDCDYTQDWAHAMMAMPLDPHECASCGTGYYTALAAKTCC